MKELANSMIKLYLGNSTLQEVINEMNLVEFGAMLESWREVSQSL